MQDRPVMSLYAWRIERGMNQTELARQSGADRSVISAIESGRNLVWYLSPKKMQAVCKALDVHYTQVIEFAERIAQQQGNADGLETMVSPQPAAV